ncbi:hypothetical protein PMAYCL1PPCAC_25762 [Pristionchus mayeri]|uniref:Uncharacterized protein n=1 Tax=Pristionchus mayeri TaxID=1317129 RepID=A0AAN5D4I8_9BILA|nr:hypothetical protein PMAYCL1PPCAC_25762 [Pristionchus mayeri]
MHFITDLLLALRFLWYSGSFLSSLLFRVYGCLSVPSFRFFAPGFPGNGACFVVFFTAFPEDFLYFLGGINGRSSSSDIGACFGLLGSLVGHFSLYHAFTSSGLKVFFSMLFFILAGTVRRRANRFDRCMSHSRSVVSFTKSGRDKNEENGVREMYRLSLIHRWKVLANIHFGSRFLFPILPPPTLRVITFLSFSLALSLFPTIPSSSLPPHSHSHLCSFSRVVFARFRNRNFKISDPFAVLNRVMVTNKFTKHRVKGTNAQLSATIKIAQNIQNSSII